VSMTAIRGGYLQAIGATLVRGRYFTSQDDEHGAPVAIVTQSIARQYWPGQNPIGKRLKWGQVQAPTPWMTIVGEVADVKQGALDAPAAPLVYVSSDQLESTLPREYHSIYLPQVLRSMFVVVRGRAATGPLAVGLRNAVHAIDSRLAIAALQPLTETMTASAAPQRFNMLLMLAFAGLALALAAIGVYGVMAYSVAQRTQEIGIRMALGADASEVVRLVLRGGLRQAVLGVVIGTAAAAALTPALRSLLFGVKPLDVPTFVGAALVLLTVAALASYIPARRASRVDPQAALRSE
ncbi:MAG: FtsX-like permease family protein, partial [Solirubrobacteraceae bacterium]